MQACYAQSSKIKCIFITIKIVTMVDNNENVDSTSYQLLLLNVLVRQDTNKKLCSCYVL